jgi:hypothetical protein
MKFNFRWLLLVSVILIYSCNEKAAQPNDAFKSTWYAGKAEVSSYILQQARYGEIRNGEAALIFVTEDFSTKKLVKLDEPDRTSDKIRVLKMNMTKNFVTGVYPYSMMLSAFTPISKEGKERTLKIYCTSQEWCGQTFSQLQLNGNNYDWKLYSYFEKEGEQDKNLNAVVLEDEIWNRIRINPSSLPQGKVSLLPGLLWQRLSHTELKEEEAVLTLSKADNFYTKDSTVQMYSIQYPAAQRVLKIYFKSVFPYEILEWQETYPDGFGKNKKMLTTKAVLKKTIWLDYWKHNSINDSTYRDTLQLWK